MGRGCRWISELAGPFTEQAAEEGHPALSPARAMDDAGLPGPLQFPFIPEVLDVLILAQP